jgi:hypothetical protein
VIDARVHRIIELLHLPPSAKIPAVTIPKNLLLFLALLLGLVAMGAVGGKPAPVPPPTPTKTSATCRA